MDILIKGAILCISVISVYLYAISQHFSLVQSQTFAFAAWNFGHIVLAFISRSEKESIFSLGMFTNKVINIWAAAAIILLMLGIYVPFLNERFNLTAITMMQLLVIAFASLGIVGFLELRKKF